MSMVTKLYLYIPPFSPHPSNPLSFCCQCGMSVFRLEDDDESGDDEDIITRGQLKKQALTLVESKNKKHKVRARKKKGK